MLYTHESDFLLSCSRLNRGHWADLIWSVHREAHTDCFWPLGRGDVSGQVWVVHRRRLLHRVRLQRRHSSPVVLERQTPHYWGQPEQQWVVLQEVTQMKFPQSGGFLVTLFFSQVIILHPGPCWPDMTTRWCVCLCVQSWDWLLVELKVGIALDRFYSYNFYSSRLLTWNTQFCS